MYERIALARSELTGPQLLAGVGLLALLGVTLLFLQEPAAHDSLHSFRHSAGITCH